MVKLLLSRGANINAFDKKDRRAIHWAAYMGESVHSGHSVDVNGRCWHVVLDRREFDSSPSHLSVSGHLEVVKLLVASGAEVDCKDKKAYTPLHAAASSGMSSTVHYLLSLGVNVSTDIRTVSLKCRLCHQNFLL